MARAGARVLGIDLVAGRARCGGTACARGKVRPSISGRSRRRSWRRERPAGFDLVTCMEMLEHVPDPAGSIARLGGTGAARRRCHRLHAEPQPAWHSRWRSSAPNTSPRVLPRGTHEYLKFIRPSELARWGRAAGLELRDLTGITYNPLTRAFRLSPNTERQLSGAFLEPGPALTWPPAASGVIRSGRHLARHRAGHGRLR